MGWVMLALVAGAAMALLALLRLPRMLWSLGSAAVMLGAAGYAWQGRPDVPAHAAAPAKVSLDPGDQYRKVRSALFGQFGGESMYFGISDAALRTGNTAIAAHILSGGVNYAPSSFAMWTELGTVIARHDRDTVSPAAKLAFRRAMLLAPDHPGPPFFLALAYIRAGDADAAKPWLRRAAALTPPGVSYRAAMAALVADTAARARFSPPTPDMAGPDRPPRP